MSQTRRSRSSPSSRNPTSISSLSGTPCERLDPAIVGKARDVSRRHHPSAGNGRVLRCCLPTRKRAPLPSTWPRSSGSCPRLLFADAEAGEQLVEDRLVDGFTAQLAEAI